MNPIATVEKKRQPFLFLTPPTVPVTWANMTDTRVDTAIATKILTHDV